MMILLFMKGNTLKNQILQIYPHCLFSSVRTGPTDQDKQTLI